MDRARELFNQLQNAEAIRSLIGQSEDVHFDCKEWPPNDGDAQRILAKAACGLTNAEGGVIIIGMKARPMAKDEPDSVDSAAPVENTRAVRSRVLDLIGQLVEPGIEAVEAVEVNEATGSLSGFVVVYIPASEGPPRRSRKDWKFYLRIGSGTFPMEYFQIEERFGRRPSAKLELYFEQLGVTGTQIHYPSRYFVLGLRNAGGGVAKFPTVRYRTASGLLVDKFGIDGNGGFGIPRRPSENEWAVFRGGVDDVIYPDETRKIAKLHQPGGNTDANGLPLPKTYGPHSQPLARWMFKATTFDCEISCEGIPTLKLQVSIPEDTQDFPAQAWR